MYAHVLVSVFRISSSHCAGMDLSLRHLYGNHEYVYHQISEEEDSRSDYAFVTSDDDQTFSRTGIPSENRTAPKPLQRVRGAPRRHVYADKETQTTSNLQPKSPYTTSAYASSTYSTSTMQTSLDTIHTEPSTCHGIRPTDSRPSKPSEACPMTDSAIELHTLTPAYPHRYPPGIVVIKTLDEQGIEVFEETDLTHRNALFIDLKPTVATKVELTGVVQRTGRAGLMERALGRIVDALARDEDDR